MTSPCKAGLVHPLSSRLDHRPPDGAKRYSIVDISSNLYSVPRYLVRGLARSDSSTDNFAGVRVHTPGLPTIPGPGISQPAINARGVRPSVIATIPSILIARHTNVDQAQHALPSLPRRHIHIPSSSPSPSCHLRVNLRLQHVGLMAQTLRHRRSF